MNLSSTITRYLSMRSFGMILNNPNTNYTGTLLDDHQDHSENFTCWAPKKCVGGLIIPMWPLPPSDSNENRDLAIAYRAIVYVAGLFYVLLGVRIITDKIVSATEFMASHRRTVTVRLKSGNESTLKLPVWHPIVAALSFEVIGTSAPEILLPVVEIFKTNFHGNELGPSLIIGSGAYRLFVITAVCLFSVRESSGKAIKDLSVFFTTGAFSLFAYLWVYLLLDIISPGIIEVWEAVVTVLMFPLLLLTGWIVANRFPAGLISSLTNLISKRNRAAVSPTLSTTSTQTSGTSPDHFGGDKSQRKLLRARIRELKQQYPDKSRQDIDEMAMLEILENDSRLKSYSHYRLKGSREARATNHVQGLVEALAAQNKEKIVSTQTVGFQSSRQSCIESCGTISIPVERAGTGIETTTLSVEYETIPGTAKGNVNYRTTNGRLIFEPGDDRSEIVISILDDEVYEQVAKSFKVKLSKPMIEHPTSSLSVPRGDDHLTKVSRIELLITETTIAILDDDHCGVFAFEKAEIPVPDNVGVAKIKVTRSIGTKGFVRVPYRISPGTAKAGEDYIAIANGVLPFANGQYEAFIEIRIVDKDRFGEVFNFYIELLAPKKESSADIKNTVRQPTLGNPNIVLIGICENEETKEALDRLLKTPEVTAIVITSRWKDQFLEAFTIPREEDDENVDVNNRNIFTYYFIPYLYQILAFPWKLLVAVFPPARLFNGWMAYISLLCLMVVMAILIDDCASLFACTIGLKDTITAITLIPFGMGLPDTFASRRAAIYEKTADASIGSIFGSNAVSVFLGIGLSWTIGSIYQTVKGNHLSIPSGDLGFTVMLFCTFAAAGILVLLLRRLPPIRGELGGPNQIKYLSGTFFFVLWIVFIVLASLESYCFIPGFKD